MTYRIKYENGSYDTCEAKNIEEATQIALERAHKIKTKVLRVYQ